VFNERQRTPLLSFSCPAGHLGTKQQNSSQLSSTPESTELFCIKIKTSPGQAPKLCNTILGASAMAVIKINKLRNV